MWIIISSVLVHIIFLSAVYDLYLNSQAIFGNGNYTKNLQPASKRFVIFLVDGLNENNLVSVNTSDLGGFPILNSSRMEYLRSVGGNNSIWGGVVMNTPKILSPDAGVMALLTGFPEYFHPYVSWNETVILDSIFNQTKYTCAWGTVDLITIFNKEKMKHVHIYPNEPILNNHEDSNYLDDWVTDQVLKHFQKNSNNSKLRSEKVLFYIHFPGVGLRERLKTWDQKPLNYTLKNLDKNIKEIVKAIEKFYSDEKTTYLFISSHGEFSKKPAGMGFELTSTMPFVMWGSAVDHTPRNLTNKYLNTYKKRTDLRFHDLTFVISTILGLAIPKSCKGIFTEINWTLSEKQKAEALYASLVQIGSEFKFLEKIMVSRYGYESFSDLDFGKYQYTLHHIKDLIQYEEYADAISNGLNLHTQILNGWKYYRTYHEKICMVILCITMFVWIIILLEYVIRPSIARYPLKYAPSCICTELQYRTVVAGYFVIIYVVVTFITYYFYVAHIADQLITIEPFFAIVTELPCIFFLYSCLPLFLSCIMMTYFDTWVRAIHIFFEIDIYAKLKSFLFIISFFLVSNFLSLLFVNRFLLSFAIVMSSVWSLVLQTQLDFLNRSIQRWIVSTVLLTMFFSMDLLNVDGPFVGVLSMSGALWILMALYILFKYGFNEGFYQDRYLVVILQPWILALAVGLISVIHFCETPDEYYSYIQWGTWLLIVMALVIPLFGGNSVKTRVEQAYLSLAVPFMFLSTGFEPLFLLIFCFHVYNWMEIECILITDKQRDDSNEDVIPIRKLAQFTFDLKVEPKINSKYVNWDDFRRCLYCTMFILIGCFATDNMSSERFRDPLLLKTFYSASFAFETNCVYLLYLMKVLIPILIVLIAFRAVNIITHGSFRRTMYIILAYLTLIAKNIFCIVYEYPTTQYFGIAFADFMAIEALILFVIVAYGVSVLYTKFSILDLPMITSKFKLNTCTL